jgi:hypothetical protein
MPWLWKVKCTHYSYAIKNIKGEAYEVLVAELEEVEPYAMEVLPLKFSARSVFFSNPRVRY